MGLTLFCGLYLTLFRRLMIVFPMGLVILHSLHMILRDVVCLGFRLGGFTLRDFSG